ncbi:MAG: hypothetical protein ACJ8FO_07510, partial [Sphingomicrobium sp.]
MTSAPVIAAKLIWKAAKTSSGMALPLVPTGQADASPRPANPTFAIITPALVVGAFAERVRFSAMLTFSVLWLLFVYVPLAHWVWGDGWLQKMGLLDFAGGTVVHANAGVAALICALTLGRRR